MTDLNELMRSALDISQLKKLPVRADAFSVEDAKAIVELIAESDRCKHLDELLIAFYAGTIGPGSLVDQIKVMGEHTWQDVQELRRASMMPEVDDEHALFVGADSGGRRA